MNLSAAQIEALREMARAAIGKEHEKAAFGEVGGELLAALCDGWLRDEAFDPYEHCCCGECN